MNSPLQTTWNSCTRMQRVAIAIWIFGTCCLPIGILLDSELALLRYRLNLDQLVPAWLGQIPGPLRIISIPVAAVFASLFLPVTRPGKIALAMIPTAILMMTIAVWLFSTLFLAGWPQN